MLCVPMFCDKRYKVCENGDIYGIYGKKIKPRSVGGKKYKQLWVGKKSILWHTAVLQSFNPVPFASRLGLQVDHKNGVHDCNSLNNLQWVTCRLNHLLRKRDVDCGIIRNRKSFRSQMTIKNKVKGLGTFKKIQDARNAVTECRDIEIKKEQKLVQFRIKIAKLANSFIEVCKLL